MASPLHDLQIQALELSPAERVELADCLLASVGSNDEVEAAWSIEVQRRLIEIESGKMESVTLEHAVAHARRSHV